MAYTQDGDPPLYFELRGDDDAPTLVMIRGLGRSARHWPEPLLAALEEDFRLLLFDNRGVGRSRSLGAVRGWAAALRQPLSTLTMAADVVRVMDAASVARAHVFGMSLGGMVAQQLALHFHERLLGLVLGCTSSGGFQAQRPKLEVLLSLVKGRLHSRSATIEAEAALQLSEGYRRAHPEVLAGWQLLATQQPTSFGSILAQLGAALRHNTRARLGDVATPTMVMTSDEDQLMPPANSLTLARLIPAAELFWVRGAGHDFVTEQPQLCASTMRRFLGNSTRAC